MERGEEQEMRREERSGLEDWERVKENEKVREAGSDGERGLGEAERGKEG